MEIAFAVGQTKQCDERVYSMLLLLLLLSLLLLLLLVLCIPIPNAEDAGSSQPLAQLNALITLFTWLLLAMLLLALQHFASDFYQQQTAEVAAATNLRQSHGNCK